MTKKLVIDDSQSSLE